jgi:hypothetical protein
LLGRAYLEEQLRLSIESFIIDGDGDTYVLNSDYDSLGHLLLGNHSRLSPQARQFVADYLGDEAARLLR